MYYDGSTTIMWSFNAVVNDFPLPCRRVKSQLDKYSWSDLCLVSKVLQLSYDVKQNLR